jgi:hypothetical protein
MPSDRLRLTDARSTERAPAAPTYAVRPRPQGDYEILRLKPHQRAGDTVTAEPICFCPSLHRAAEVAEMLGDQARAIAEGRE